MVNLNASRVLSPTLPVAFLWGAQLSAVLVLIVWATFRGGQFFFFLVSGYLFHLSFTLLSICVGVGTAEGSP